jgi:hypothetical protein
MPYSLIGTQVVRDDGYVAMENHNSNSANVAVAETTYIFTPKNNISFCWVKPEHVGRLLTLKTSVCCGNNNTNRFHLASFINTNLWHGLDRDGNPK